MKCITGTTEMQSYIYRNNCGIFSRITAMKQYRDLECVLMMTDYDLVVKRGMWLMT